MESRTNFGLRKLIDLSLRMVEKGVLSVEHAADAMEHAGAPFSVIGRVLAPYRQAPTMTAGARARSAVGLAA